MADLGDLTARLTANMDDLDRTLKEAERRMNDYDRSVDQSTEKARSRWRRYVDDTKAQAKNLGGQLYSLQKRWGAVANAAAAAGGAFAVGTVVKQSISQYAQLEQNLTEVEKVTSLTTGELNSLRSEVQRMATEVPVTTDELLNIAGAAGRLGVQGRDNILSFTQTVAKLGRATDLQGEQAATTLARILNVTGESPSQVEELGSALVALGNNAAATESEIAKMTNEVARSTSDFNVASHEAAALATAMVEMGVRAEAGGTTVGQAMRAISKAVRDGGDAMEELQRLTGMSMGQIRSQLQDNPIRLLQEFLVGVRDDGRDASVVLDKFGLTGERAAKALVPLINNTGALEGHLRRANREVEDATALDREFEKAISTLQGEMDLLRSTAGVAGERIGEELAPAVRKVSESLRDLMNDEETIDTFAENLGSVASKLDEIAAAGVKAFDKLEDLMGLMGSGFSGFQSEAIEEAQKRRAEGTFNPFEKDNLSGLQTKIMRLSEQRNKLQTDLQTDSGMLGFFDDTEEKKKELQEYNRRIGEIRDKILEINRRRNVIDKALGLQVEMSQDPMAPLFQGRGGGGGDPTTGGSDSSPDDEDNGESGLEAMKKRAREIDVIMNDAIRRQAAMEEGAAQRRAEAYEELDQEWEKAVKQFDKLEKETKEGAKSMSDTLRNAISGWASDFSRQLNELVWQADTSFEQIVKSFGKMLTRMMIQQQIVQPILGGFSGMLGGGAGGGMAPTAFAHSGGIVGSLSQRGFVDPAVFAGAPKYHTGGVVGDEQPVMAKKGEGIFTPEQMSRLAPAGKGGGNVEVNIHGAPNPEDIETQEQDTPSGKKLDIFLSRKMAEQAADPGSPFMKQLRANTNIKPKVAER